MTRIELKEILLSFDSKWRSRKIANIPEVTVFLNSMYPGVNINSQIYCFLNNKSPYCETCNKILKDHRKRTCSYECREKIIDHDNRVSKQKNTLIEKYGVDNARNIPGMDKRIKSTMLNRYGMLVSPKSLKSIKERAPILQKKSKKTLQERYGVDNPSQIPGHYEKCKNTLIKNYGVDHYTKIEKYITASADKKLQNYIKSCPQEITIINIHEPPIDLKSTYNNPNIRIEFSCSSCNTSEIVPMETFKYRLRSSSTCCKLCSGIKSGSLMEKELSSFVQTLVNYPLILNNRSILNNKELDIYDSNNNIGIEFNGLYWHNDLLIDKNYHLNKTIEAEEKNIKLIHIFEDEWLHKKEIVKSRLKNIFNKNDNIIHGRKCSIRVISTDDERKFLDKNHIQGYTPSSVKLGLIHEDNIVSVMTFSKPNLSKGQRKENNFWELLRFCSLLNTTVIGGANKLFNYFVKNYSPEKILSFSDKRWNTGKIYSTLGFTYINDTKPNYWYINTSKGIRLHRFGLRKNLSDNQTLTEYENRKKQGYLRIWDCGSSKWIWTKNKGA